MGHISEWLSAERLPEAQASAADQLELRRIRGEYLEMPGLCLTQCQAQRLWGLPCDRCQDLLAALVRERFLVQTAEGRFVRSNTARGAPSLWRHGGLE